MANNRVQIEINGKDNASPVFSNIQKALGNVGTKATAISFAFNQVTAAIATVTAALRPMIDAALTMEKIESTMRVAAGSSEAAGRELAFVRAEAQRLGLSFIDVSVAYSKFSVASKGTVLEGEGVRKIFSAVANAATALRLSTEDTQGIFKALEQMMSKGTIQAEELRGQLGDRLPGAFNLTAKAMGVSTKALGEMLKNGEVVSSEVLPKLAVELNKTYGPEAAKGAESLRGSLNRFNDELKSSAAIFGQSIAPAVQVVLQWVSQLARAFVNLVSYVEIFAIGTAAAFDKAIVYASSLVNGDAFSSAGQARIKQQIASINQAAEESFRDLEKKYGVHQQTMEQTGMTGAQKAEMEGQRRRDAAKKTGDDLIKIQQTYANEIGTSEQRLSAEYQKTYEDRKKALIAYYDQLKASASSNREEEQYEKMKKQRLLELEKQHAQDVELVRLRTTADSVAARKSAVDQEIALINKQAADQVISASEAQRQITALTVASLQDQYSARKAAADKALQIYGTDSAEYRARLKEMESAHSAYTAANLEAYRRYSDAIKNLDKEIADFRLSIQQKIADLQQRGMTEGEKYADNQKRFDEAVSKSKEALARKDYETAQKYAKQAEELASRLADKKAEQNTKLQELDRQHQERLADIAKQNTGKQSDQQRQQSEMEKENLRYQEERRKVLAEQQATTEGITNATRALNQVEELGVSIMEAKKQENQDALEKLKEIQAIKLDPKNVQVTMDEGALGAVRAQIAALTRDETKTIYIRTVEKRAHGGRVGMNRGGKLPGDSLIDSIPVLARPGEWFIRNESAKFWGDGFMAAINAPLSAAGQKLQAAMGMQKFSAGGQVQPVDMGNINITVGNGAFPVQGKQNILAGLKQELRREQMRRPQ